MHGDKDRAALSVGHGGTIIEGRILVSLACLHYLEALGLQCGFDLSSKLQHDIAFVQATGAACAEVSAAVGWVEDDDI